MYKGSIWGLGKMALSHFCIERGRKCMLLSEQPNRLFSSLHELHSSEVHSANPSFWPPRPENLEANTFVHNGWAGSSCGGRGAKAQPHAGTEPFISQAGPAAARGPCGTRGGRAPANLGIAGLAMKDGQAIRERTVNDCEWIAGHSDGSGRTVRGPPPGAGGGCDARPRGALWELRQLAQPIPVAPRAERSSGSGDGSGAAAGRTETSCPCRKSPPWPACRAGRRGRGGLCRGAVTPGGGGGGALRRAVGRKGAGPLPWGKPGLGSADFCCASGEAGDPPAPHEMVAVGLHFHGIRYGMVVWGWKESGGGVEPRSPRLCGSTDRLRPPRSHRGPPSRAGYSRETAKSTRQKTPGRVFPVSHFGIKNPWCKSYLPLVNDLILKSQMMYFKP